MKLIRTFVFSLKIVPSLFFQTMKFLSVFCNPAAWFVPGLVGNLKTGPGQKPKNRFSRNVAYLIYIENKTLISCYCTADLQLFSLKQNFKINRFSQDKAHLLFLKKKVIVRLVLLH